MWKNFPWDLENVETSAVPGYLLWLFDCIEIRVAKSREHLFKAFFLESCAAPRIPVAKPFSLSHHEIALEKVATDIHQGSPRAAAWQRGPWLLVQTPRRIRDSSLHWTNVTLRLCRPSGYRFDSTFRNANQIDPKSSSFGIRVTDDTF